MMAADARVNELKYEAGTIGFISTGSGSVFTLCVPQLLVQFFPPWRPQTAQDHRSPSSAYRAALPSPRREPFFRLTATLALRDPGAEILKPEAGQIPHRQCWRQLTEEDV